MDAYLQTWTGGVESARERESEPLEYAGSNQYPKIGLTPGDTLYIVYLDEKRMHLIGRLPVAEVIDRAEAVRRRGPEIWDADWWAVARRPDADPHAFDLRVPDDIVRQLRFVRVSGEITTLDPAADGTLDGKALQAIRRLTQQSTALLDSLHEPVSDPPGAGAAAGRGQRLTAAERKVVELQAMHVAKDHYEAHGWTVRDVSASRPYDLECESGDRTLHVEVKGSTGELAAIELTRGEVTHAETCQREVALALVTQIALDRRSEPEATDGELRLIEPWSIDQGALEPTRYIYRLSE